MTKNCDQSWAGSEAARLHPAGAVPGRPRNGFAFQKGR
jgi:hypothetical protein